jgi:hypothetical protein
MGTIELEEFKHPEVEVWIQIIGEGSYKHFKTGEIIEKSNFDSRDRLNKKFIILDFVKGKSIL